MAKSIPKSRLHITYRTRIDGATVPQKLPLRLLVLGNFYGGHPGPIPEQDDLPTDLWTFHPNASLGSRTVKSLKGSARIDDFMKGMQVMAPISTPDLVSVLYGRVGPCDVQLKLGAITRDDKNKAISAKVGFRGVGKIAGQKSDPTNMVGSFKGNVFIEGEADAEVLNEEDGVYKLKVAAKATARGVVTGDISGRLGATGDDGEYRGQAIDIKLAPGADPADPKGTIPPAPTGDSFEFTFQAKPENNRARISVAEPVPVYLTLPIDGLDCFSPEHVAARVPEIHRLSLIKKLLQRLRTKIANSYVFSQQLGAIIRDPDQVAALDKIQTALTTSQYKHLAMVPAKPDADPPQPPTPAPPTTPDVPPTTPEPPPS